MGGTPYPLLPPPQKKRKEKKRRGGGGYGAKGFQKGVCCSFEVTPRFNKGLQKHSFACGTSKGTPSPPYFFFEVGGSVIPKKITDPPTP